MISHQINPNSIQLGYYSEGSQMFAMNTTCVKLHFIDQLESTSEAIALNSPSSSSSTKQNYLEQFRTCYIPCSKENKPISFINTTHTNPFCYNDNWGDCNKDCLQSQITRSLYSISNNSEIYHQCQENENKVYRRCWNQRCKFNLFYDCGYLLQVTLPSFDIRLWSNAWKEELIYAMTKALQVSKLLSLLSF